MSDDSDFLFADEPDPTPVSDSKKVIKYKLLIVDDEKDVHEVTKLVLHDFTFDGGVLEILHAYSGQEAKEIMLKEVDIAVVLLDVVMETPDAGLLVADWIRKTLLNKSVRIVLRTGQPGDAPEDKVIVKYDIHDYKEKTELTNRKLNTLLYSCLRSYRDIKTISRSCEQLSEMVQLSDRIFKKQDIHSFCDSVLDSLLKFLSGNEYESLLMMSSFQVLDKDIIHATGRFDNAVGGNWRDYCDLIPFEQLDNIDGTNFVFFENNFYCCIKRKDHEILLFIESLKHTEDIDHILLNLFMNYISVGYDNISSRK
ncbi:MAG: DUF3369 domain-containing protein [Saccharospirillaceae bacterium]|nr:DUF3369 domain-containing protein [Pseudomonadales bacterium]NRB79427.1 DUF3369 domain-containing protein [Saccharospirillaceae bacterium]